MVTALVVISFESHVCSAHKEPPPPPVVNENIIGGVVRMRTITPVIV